MKKLLLISCLLLAAANTQAQHYLFFLHNMWVELNGTEVAHPEYGKTEYNEAVAKFRKEGLIVISEQRPKGTNGNEYAVKVAHQIDSLLKKGVPASHITVAGTSKGGFITMYTSGILKNTDINYVLIGCCSEQAEADDAIHLYGNVLSIYEESDAYHSCQQVKAKPGSDVKHFKEIELHTGLKHGFLYKAADNWIKPTAEWARGNYK
jgi:hypothetical protein